MSNLVRNPDCWNSHCCREHHIGVIQHVKFFKFCDKKFMFNYRLFTHYVTVWHSPVSLGMIVDLYLTIYLLS